MYSKSLGGLVLLLAILFIASLFSFLETATVAVSEYRLNIVKDKHRWAYCAARLKQELDKVLIFSLCGNSLFNAVFTTLTMVYISRSGRVTLLSLPILTVIIALLIIVFSEVIPKIIAARSPVMTLRVIAIPLYYIFIMSKPLIWTLDSVVGVLIYLLKIDRGETTSLEEIRAIIADKRSPLKEKHRSILLNSIELESITIKEVLIPLRMVESIDINGDIEVIYKQIYTTHHTRIIVYENEIDNIIGFIHVKDFLAFDEKSFTLEALKQCVRPLTYVNDFIPVIKQINRAQKYRSRVFVVINEYGDVSGIACLEDMLEMIFGDFTTESPQQSNLAIKTEDNQLIVDGTMLIRELNELYNLGIAVKADAFTVNGLVLKTLDGIPGVGVCFRLEDLIFEVISVGTYWVERVRITFATNASRRV